MLSQKKTNCYPLPITPKNVTALPCKMKKYHHFIIILFHSLQMLVALKRAGCGLALVALKMTDQRNKKTDHRIRLRR